MEDLDQRPSSPAWCLEGTYSEQDLRAFAAFLAGRVAGSKFWTLGFLALMPLWWSGDIRQTWPYVAPIGVLIIGFLLLLRFVLLPRRLYRKAIQLPGVFEPRRILIDAQELQNTSEAGGHTLPLERIQEVITTPDHLYVLVAPKQGVPIPRAWLKEGQRAEALIQRLLSRRLSSPA
jgi:hypothetical protein